MTNKVTVEVELEAEVAVVGRSERIYWVVGAAEVVLYGGA